MPGGRMRAVVGVAPRRRAAPLSGGRGGLHVRTQAHTGPVTFDFPADLVELQRKWFTADADRTTAAQNDDNEAFKAARYAAAGADDGAAPAPLDARLRDPVSGPHGAPGRRARGTRMSVRAEPSSDSMTVSILHTIAAHTWEPPVGEDRTARLDELREVAGDRVDLLA